MHGTPLRGKRVVVQRYGKTNRELQAALERAGAEVIEIVTYRWALPEDTAPLLRLIDALGRDEIDLVAFTSASQATNLFAVARYADDCRCFSRICAATPISGSRERRMAIEYRH